MNKQPTDKQITQTKRRAAPPPAPPPPRRIKEGREYPTPKPMAIPTPTMPKITKKKREDSGTDWTKVKKFEKLRDLNPLKR